jgi:hypothetical protein
MLGFGRPPTGVSQPRPVAALQEVSVEQQYTLHLGVLLDRPFIYYDKS